jgi:probable DNA repair protein
LRPLRHRDLIFAARRLESFTDDVAPALARGTARGGTRALTDQSACPFKAFARHRLGAEALETPQAGPDALDRGLLLHELMKGIWTELKASAALSGEPGPVIERSAARAVKELGLEGRFAELERERLARLAREWLEVERERGGFEVVALEERRSLAIGTLELSGRIDRLDRLPGGGHALIDYKTSRLLTPRQWMGGRPEDPQLPLYAVCAGEDVSAVAFAKLRAGEMRFTGYSREEGALPGVTRYDSWKALIDGWRKELEALARGFASGDARVDPKEGLKTCSRCDLQTLCRVHERLSALAEVGEGE